MQPCAGIWMAGSKVLNLNVLTKRDHSCAHAGLQVQPQVSRLPNWGAPQSTLGPSSSSRCAAVKPLRATRHLTDPDPSVSAGCCWKTR